ncbi:permease-like cell division protein FtsX [Allocoprobacillus halotolerans]|uniref:Permease-like cell division protein FtsX n=1 Tax=Allocoprobacillus halotolerans TaxID=2944914 RepID=A0ABY5I648_9FIRM|nr:permease-like cell division protein FtsX [Allocoprobacillus halotolerans]UTY40827.1 permease-like cell division protein FtsX [Allocoprobacillus halotolerans]
MIEKQDEDGKKLFEGYRENNPLGAAYIVEVNDASEIDTVADKISALDHVNDATSGEHQQRL